jgi:hypothetical protein
MAANTHGLNADSCLVIADSCLVIADSCLVIADSIRNPVLARHWIPDVETPDLIRGRDDRLRN